MTEQAHTIARIVYGAARVPDFGRIAEDLVRAFANCPADGRRITRDRDDRIILDLLGSRIILAQSRGVTGACLTVAVGHGPQGGVAGLAERRGTLTRMIVERIAGRAAPQRVLWAEGCGALLPESLDPQTEPVTPRLREVLTGADQPLRNAATRVVMRAAEATLIVARMPAQVCAVARGRLVAGSGDPSEALSSILGTHHRTPPRVRPRRVLATTA